MTSNLVKVLLVRHGETDWNASRRIQGSTDIELNDVGREQARAAAQKFVDAGIEHIFSSTKKRARETAEIFSKHLDVSVTEHIDLSEIFYGEIEGKTELEIKDLYGENFINRWSCESDWEFNFANGESRGQARDRMRAALENFFLENSFKTVMVATHGAVMRYFLNSIVNDGSSVGRIGNCHCFEIHFDRAQKVWTYKGPHI